MFSASMSLECALITQLLVQWGYSSEEKPRLNSESSSLQVQMISGSEADSSMKSLSKAMGNFLRYRATNDLALIFLQAFYCECQYTAL